MMKRNLRKTLLATAIGATVMTPVAFGQTSTEFAEQGENCQALDRLIDENSDRLRSDWVLQTRAVVRADDQDRCRDYYDQAVDALRPRDQQTDQQAAARIVVTQPDPEVNVQQRAPLVSVTQQEPRVQVNQGQPQITVRQAPPNVRVQIPQPIVTIDMPQPEITVRMPDPNVAVTNPEPQVEVRQQPPEVNVSQPEPQVSVQAEQASQSENTREDDNVQLQQQEPRVEVQSTGNEAQIDVQRQQPSVQYEAAEPNIQVEEQGEPIIRFNQTGEPNIRFESSDASDNQNAAASDRSGEGEVQQPNPTPAPGDIAQTDAPRLYELLAGDESMEAGRPLEYYAGDISGRELRNLRGDLLGSVDRVIITDGRHYLVLAEGGFLGLGEREVSIPLDSVSVVDGELVMRGMSQEDIDALPEFDSENAEEVSGDERVQIGTP